MINSNSFGVLGGDRRQVALAESLASDGYEVSVCGFDSVTFSKNIKKTVLEELIQECENIILPLPVTADGKHLKMDFSDDLIVLDDAFARRLRGKQVFGGMMGKLFQSSEVWKTIDAYDYFAREEFAVRNAVPTAEGAIEIAMREYPGTINGSSCLVAGFGRIGKFLTLMLRGLGARVTVSARKASDFAWITSCGCTTLPSSEIRGRFDLIFNTIPALIFDRATLLRLEGCPILIDLASLPGGVDDSEAEKIGVKAIHALSLPGKVAPKAAGEIMKHTIYNIMEE